MLSKESTRHILNLRLKLDEFEARYIGSNLMKWCVAGCPLNGTVMFGPVLSDPPLKICNIAFFACPIFFHSGNTIAKI